MPKKYSADEPVREGAAEPEPVQEAVVGESVYQEAAESASPVGQGVESPWEGRENPTLTPEERAAEMRNQPVVFDVNAARRIETSSAVGLPPDAYDRRQRFDRAIREAADVIDEGPVAGVDSEAAQRDLNNFPARVDSEPNV